MEPSTSRSTTTTRCRSGRPASAVRITSHASTAIAWSSGPAASADRPASTASHTGASAGCVDQHTVRASRSRLLRAVFTRMRMSHVLNVDRPSKPSTLRSTATQVSWTTSSAASALPRIERATRNINGVCRRTSSR